MRVFGIIGWKNSGKTTMVARVVENLIARGLTVSTLKHAHHAFDLDQKDTDSSRHRSAGATEVALVSGNRWALMHELKGREKPTMREMLDKLSPCDLVLVEGFKSESHPKLEMRRAEARETTPMEKDFPNVKAIASDLPEIKAEIAIFKLDEINAISDFILDQAEVLS